MAWSLHQLGDVIVDPTQEQLEERQKCAFRYRIIKILGQGNSGITYAAEDITQPGVTVAIKVISFQKTQDWKVMELFEREAQVLQKLQHRGIPRYLNYFHIDSKSDGGTPTFSNRRFYIVQELAQGKSLATWVEQGWRADETSLKETARQILAILVYLQRLDPPIIHRDIKPENIIRYEDGSLYLVDFGAVRDTYYSTLMRGSTVVGTYGYMAPEQFLGQAVPTTDLYGLGATLLYLLTHKSPAELPQDGLSVDFRNQIQVSDAFADWLEKLLEPDVKNRFPSAEAALLALRQPPKAVQVSRQISLRTAFYALIIGTVAAIWLGNSFKWRVLSTFGLVPRGICENTSVISNYLQQGGNPNLPVKHNRMLWRGGDKWPLLLCAYPLASTKLLLEYGADPNIEESGDPILYRAALDNNFDLMKLLLKYGANPNVKIIYKSNHKVSDSETPLVSQLISIGQEQAAEFLIKNGADINAENSDGDTPLDVALSSYRFKIALLLLEKGGRTNKEYNSERLREWEQEFKQKNN